MPPLMYFLLWMCHRTLNFVQGFTLPGSGCCCIVFLFWICPRAGCWCPSKTSIFSISSWNLLIKGSAFLISREIFERKKYAPAMINFRFKFKVRKVRRLGIGLARDLRGIVQSTYNKVAYSTFFDWIYPKHFGQVVIQLMFGWILIQNVSRSYVC